jgi:hypothetical protein
METHNQVEQWVAQRMAATQLPTDWPDPAAARRRVDERLEKRPRRPLVWASVTAALCLAAVFVVPTSRAVAGRLWDQVVLGRIQVLIADYDGHGAAASFLSPELQQRPQAQPVSSLEEARVLAGFSPRLPRPGVFTASPNYSVADVTSATLRLRTPAIRFLFGQAGGSPSAVPDAWNGVVLEVRAGPVIVAEYDGVLLLQSLPFRVIKPADFDLELLYRIAFRTLGMDERDAVALSGEGSSPALLMAMPEADRNLLHEFRTPWGTGMMIDEVYGPGKIVAVWSGPGRIYALFPDTRTVSREFVITVANALE